MDCHGRNVVGKGGDDRGREEDRVGGRDVEVEGRNDIGFEGGGGVRPQGRNAIFQSGDWFIGSRGFGGGVGSFGEPLLLLLCVRGGGGHFCSSGCAFVWVSSFFLGGAAVETTCHSAAVPRGGSVPTPAAGAVGCRWRGAGEGGFVHGG